MRQPFVKHPDNSRRLFLLGGIGTAASWKAFSQTVVPVEKTSTRLDTPACMLSSEQMEGPYYIDGQMVRRNITEGKPGIPLRLRITLLDAKKCTPLENAALDLWHCDALGIYSGFVKNSMEAGPGGPPPGGFGLDSGPPPRGPGPGGPRPTDKETFLRGTQVSNASGVVEFDTIYPGWYMGRDIHIHLKVHTGGHVSHTGQLFFDEGITDAIAKLKPYQNHQVRRTRHQEDMVFNGQHGAEGLVQLAQVSKRSITDGFTASVILGVDPTATPEPTGFGPSRGFGREGRPPAPPSY
jgi:protocatechuate 3,4-dioxygenase beta subunit